MCVCGEVSLWSGRSGGRPPRHPAQIHYARKSDKHIIAFLFPSIVFVLVSCLGFCVDPASTPYWTSGFPASSVVSLYKMASVSGLTASWRAAWRRTCSGRGVGEPCRVACGGQVR